MKHPTALAVWAHCQRNGVQLFTEDGKLFAAPRERVAPDIAAAITHHKEAFIKFLLRDQLGELVPAEVRGTSYQQWLLRNIKEQSEEYRKLIAKEEREAL
jgi:hypothetical protein